MVEQCHNHLARLSYLFYGSILEDQDCTSRVINPSKYSLKKQEEEQERIQEKESCDL